MPSTNIRAPTKITQVPGLTIASSPRTINRTPRRSSTHHFWASSCARLPVMVAARCIASVGSDAWCPVISVLHSRVASSRSLAPLPAERRDHDAPLVTLVVALVVAVLPILVVLPPVLSPAFLLAVL